MQLNENIMQIIIRRLNNEASDDEESELEDWIRESPAHRHEMDAFVKLWQDSADAALKHQFKTFDAWKEVEKKTRYLPDATLPGRGAVFSIKRMSAAAAIILFVTAAIYLFNTNSKTSWQTIAAVQNNERVFLPDSSFVILRRGSTLRYPDTFGDGQRFSELNGEAYFEVRRDTQKPFRVATPGAIVEVLGTSFIVRHTDLLDQVMVTSGKVLFSEREDESNKVVLAKGQEAKLKSGRLSRDTVANANLMSWQSGKLVFHYTPLQQVVEDLSDYYQVEVKLGTEVEKDAGAITINAEFEKEPLELVLDEIGLMTGLKITRENGVVEIRK